MIPQPTKEEQSALIKGLPAERMRRFRAVFNGGDRDAVGLYLLDSLLASHFHLTFRGVEILLRESMHRSLSAAFGSEWFTTQTTLFDARTKGAIADAVKNLGRRPQPGKVVSTLMLGAWIDLLDRGGAKYKGGPKADYENDLWAPALVNTFNGSLARHDAHALTLRFRWARNRVQHCEPVVFGFPLQGQSTTPGVQDRLSPAALLHEVRVLAMRVDPATAQWFGKWNEIDALIDRPLARQALAHASTLPGVNLIT